MQEITVSLPADLKLSEEQKKKLEEAFTNTLVEHLKGRGPIVASVKNQVVSEIGRV
jgi:hypothetical protein